MATRRFASRDSRDSGDAASVMGHVPASTPQSAVPKSEATRHDAMSQNCASGFGADWSPPDSAEMKKRVR